MKNLCLALALLTMLRALPSSAEGGLPAQKEYEPKSGSGRVVVLVSGQTGPSNYTDMAHALADQDFDVVLVDGNDFWIKGGGGGALLASVIAHAQQSAHAQPGKVGVIGCSLGGASALSYATRMPEQVAAVVAQYPLTRFITDPAAFVDRIKVPTLMLVGTADSYKDCCLIGMARKLGEAASNGAAPDLLQVHEYAGAEHGFSTNNSRYRDVSSDALQRTISHLRAHLSE